MGDPTVTDSDAVEQATLFPKTAGEKLREARESQGLSIADVGARTRVPIRHLQAIEQSDYSGLPSPTYAVGFAKAYARAVGLDEANIGREVRGQREVVRPVTQYQPYQASDPARLPPRALAIGLAALALVAIVALVLWMGSGWFVDDETAPAPVDTTAAPVVAPAARPAPAPAAAAGTVELTATDVVWVRIYEGDKRLYEAEMKPGDRYQVPRDAVHPMINVGKPDKLTVTVNGNVVPPLGTGERAIKDVEVSAAALLARAAPPKSSADADQARR